MDAIVLSAASRRPVRFVMDSSIFRIPLLRTAFRGMKAVPIAPRNAEPLDPGTVTRESARERVAALRECP